MAQDPGKLSLGEQGHPQHHDLHILLSWFGFCGTFQWCLSVVLGHVPVAVVVQVIGCKNHLPDNGCTVHCWVGHLPCIVKGFAK